MRAEFIIKSIFCVHACLMLCTRTRGGLFFKNNQNTPIGSDSWRLNNKLYRAAVEAVHKLSILSTHDAHSSETTKRGTPFVTCSFSHHQWYDIRNIIDISVNANISEGSRAAGGRQYCTVLSCLRACCLSKEGWRGGWRVSRFEGNTIKMRLL